MRKHTTDNSSAISLFPFIAVLLCTMGALLVVLVSVARLARDGAQRRAEAQKQPPAAVVDDSKTRQKLNELRQQAANLHLLRNKADEQLRNDQLRLSHLEDHMRRLQDQAASLKMAAAELEAMDKEHYDDRRQAERELERLNQLVDEQQELVEFLKAEASTKKRSYAIIPYDGPNGTQRRPVYIECRRDAVILQPEGVTLKEEDFIPPLGPGNPLAAALRAAREHIVRGSDATAGKAVEPYPLILIRPDGIENYYAVRDAIASWDADFGYEFVDGDWNLRFQPPDPQLATMEAQAIEQARVRQQILAAAAPRAYRGRRSFGGDAPESGNGVGGDREFAAGASSDLEGEGSFANGSEGRSGDSNGGQSSGGQISHAATSTSGINAATDNLALRGDSRGGDAQYSATASGGNGQ
jgi:hypothetical protein